MVNRAYGILTNGTIPEGSLGYRYSDVRCPEELHKTVSSLMTLAPADMRGVFACVLIELMRSSADWVTYVDKYDSNNTYSTDVLEGSASWMLGDILFSQLVDWADNVHIKSSEFDRTDNDTAIDRVCSALFSIVSVKVD